MRAEPDLPPSQKPRRPRPSVLPAGTSTLLTIMLLLAAWILVVHG